MSLLSCLSWLELNSLKAQTSSEDSVPLEVFASDNHVVEAQPFFSFAERLALACLALLLATAVVVTYWPTRSKPLGPLANLALGPKAENLFLGIKFGIQDNTNTDTEPKTFFGHLRQLDLYTATLISPVELPKGTEVKLLLDSLPNFPQRKFAVPADVEKCAPFNRHLKSYKIDLHWNRLDEPQKNVVIAYLESLTQRARSFRQSMPT